MKRETEFYLARSESSLRLARMLLGQGWPAEAARAAYFAAFHAAQGLIFERREAVARTHRGVQAGLIQEIAGSADWDPALRGFLGRGFAYKSSADYGIDPELAVTSTQAETALQTAERFVDTVRRMLEAAIGKTPATKREGDADDERQ